MTTSPCEVQCEFEDPQSPGLAGTCAEAMATGRLNTLVVRLR